jgi:hypothetical protein
LAAVIAIAAVKSKGFEFLLMDQCVSHGAFSQNTQHRDDSLILAHNGLFRSVSRPNSVARRAGLLECVLKHSLRLGLRENIRGILRNIRKYIFPCEPPCFWIG